MGCASTSSIMCEITAPTPYGEVSHARISILFSSQGNAHKLRFTSLESSFTLLVPLSFHAFLRQFLYRVKKGGKIRNEVFIVVQQPQVRAEFCYVLLRSATFYILCASLIAAIFSSVRCRPSPSTR